MTSIPTLPLRDGGAIPVIGFGTDDFPAFYSRESGHKLLMRCDTAGDVASVMTAKWALGLKGGVVVANPIPKAFEIPSTEIAPAIAEAVAAATSLGIHGKDVTPFLLARLAVKTGGGSLAANIALVKNNARVAAEIAVRFREQGQ